MASISEIIESYRLRKASEAEAARIPGLPRVPNPKVIPAAKAIDVVEEQCAAILDHYRDSLVGDSRCGCEMCVRYDRIRTVAMEALTETAQRAMGAGA